MPVLTVTTPTFITAPPDGAVVITYSIYNVGKNTLILTIIIILYLQGLLLSIAITLMSIRVSIYLL